ncbi:MAG: YqaE/Pmp3 family membrane protein [Bacteroidetes bacterium]|nr:YqaE/Pmp3 family membrane protein [Bacteroidota bacterium]MCL5737754.1 YqaE/Pmp3 family membrane protein [Bacteroidota bacterium]
MLYLLAFFLPPLAVFLCGKPIQAAVNIFLCIFLLWIPGVMHSLMVVHDHYADKRTKKIIKAIKAGNRV